MIVTIFFLYSIGPAVATINGKIMLVGVTLGGIRCAQRPFPGVFTKVSALKSWILKNSDVGYCQN